MAQRLPQTVNNSAQAMGNSIYSHTPPSPLSEGHANFPRITKEIRGGRINLTSDDGLATRDP